MVKLEIYNDLFETKTIAVKKFEDINLSSKPHEININRALSNPKLFDNITLLIENIIKSKQIKFNKICATSISAIPYATNVATSLEKAISFINDSTNNITNNIVNNEELIENNSHNERDNIKNIKIEGGLEIDDEILLIETTISNDYFIENIIQKIKKYGGNVVGIILILNKCEGEYCNLLHNNEKIYNVLNLFDIFTYLENNNLIEMFYSEKVKFYCEKETKLNIRKLIPPIPEVFSENTSENVN